jgi:4-aminobutyrate aminotransferase / (S)-3-amino-2-methylpropionate transaminase / 5-aminovalerate transaminase
MHSSSLHSQATEAVNKRWRRIRTSITFPESIPVVERLRRVEPRSMTGMPPIVWHGAEGFCVRERYDNQWIDLTSRIVMANAGHGHPRIIDANAAQPSQTSRPLLLLEKT